MPDTTSLNYAEFAAAVTALKSSTASMLAAMEDCRQTNQQMMAKFEGLAVAAYLVNSDHALRKGHAILGVVGAAGKLLDEIQSSLHQRDQDAGFINNIHVTGAVGNPLPGDGSRNTVQNLTFSVTYDFGADHGIGSSAIQNAVPYTLSK